MKGIRATQKNASQVGQPGIVGLEEQLVLFLKPTNLNRVLLNSLVNDKDQHCNVVNVI
jgi:hypothetical protein